MPDMTPADTAQAERDAAELERIATRITRIDAERDKLIPRRDALIRGLGKWGPENGWSQTHIARFAQISKQAVGFILQPPKRRKEMSRDRTARARNTRAAART